MSPKHKAHTLVIECIDFRFQEVIDADIQTRGCKGKFDRIAWPGASKDFDNIESAAKLSLKLHDPNQVLIYEHEDCGAYGPNNSEEAHRENAQKLAKSLKETKPNLQVITLFATFEGIKEL